MPMTGITIFSHILPVIFGFFGLIFVISGVLDNDNPKLGLGIALFVIAAIFPFIVLRAIIL